MGTAKNISTSDPRGLISEAYKIDGISLVECRSIFMDWAIETADGDQLSFIERLYQAYMPFHPDHPMTSVLKEGLGATLKTGRRGGSKARRSPSA